MKLGRILDKIPLSAENNKSTLLYNPNTYFGVEIELEEAFIVLLKNKVIKEINGEEYEFIDPRLNEYWNIHIDGSLRDSGLGRGGLEFVNVPFAGETAEQQLALFNELVIQPHKDFISTSSRCGFHVHLNCLDIEYKYLLNFIVTYLIFEPIIYNYVGKDREFSNYCIPIYNSINYFYNINSLLRQNLSKRQILEGLGAFNQEYRYSGLNLAALNKFGTLEFRQHRATKDFKEIIDWINILCSLKTNYINQDYQIYLEYVSIGDVYQFVEGVFGKSTDILLTNYTNKQQIRNDLYKGIRSAQLLINYQNILEVSKEFETNVVLNTKYFVEHLSKSNKKIKPKIPKLENKFFSIDGDFLNMRAEEQERVAGGGIRVIPPEEDVNPIRREF